MIRVSNLLRGSPRLSTQSKTSRFASNHYNAILLNRPTTGLNRLAILFEPESVALLMESNPSERSLRSSVCLKLRTSRCPRFPSNTARSPSFPTPVNSIALLNDEIASWMSSSACECRKRAADRQAELLSCAGMSSHFDTVGT